ncbi:hypothetical protein [Devosia ginsengisoli]|uniref:Uncharacterized protein n=1 Tax=Devosia ginsengisoli TaxID=400770 RepID=A0A5B8LRR1_9HYPH|nr:hypothetical protein [Devosia ginsengisoli]QDZ10415.1 hypothetical protein FPZ08_06435 [Devosia ginsengisoli]
MGYRGSQWEVTNHAIRRIDDEADCDIPLSQLADEDDYGIGPSYSSFPHLAESKDGVDFEDYERAFRAAWSVAKHGPLDEVKLALSVRRALVIREQHRRWRVT